MQNFNQNYGKRLTIISLLIIGEISRCQWRHCFAFLLL